MTDQITPEQLELYGKWLRGEPGGVQLNLSEADLSKANSVRFEGDPVVNSPASAISAKAHSAVINASNKLLIWFKFEVVTSKGFAHSGVSSRAVSLSEAKSKASGADLSKADLSGGRLSGAIGLRIAADAADRLKAVAAAALADGALNMCTWHKCSTTHCIAGWAVAQAGEPGCLLEQIMGTEVAGLMLLGTEAHSHFFDSDADARAYLQSVLESGEGND